MINKIKEIFFLLEKKQQKKIIYLQIIILLTACMEVLSLFAIAPFMSILADYDVINKEGYISDLYNYLEFQNPKDFLFFFALFFLCILSISSLIHMVTIWIVSINSIKMGTTLGNRLFSFYLNQNWLFHVKSNSAQLINKIAQESDRITLGIIQPAMLINAKLAVSVFLIIAMIIYNPFVALIVGLILGTSYVIIFLYVKNSVMRNGKIVSSTQESRYKLMSEGFGGIKEVLISGRQNFFTFNFKKNSNQWADAIGKNQAIGQLPRYIVELITFSIIVGFVIYLTSKGEENNFKTLFPVLSIYALGGLKLLPAFQSIFVYLTAIKANINAYENIKENLIEAKNQDLKPRIKDFKKSIEMNLNNELVFKNVNFKYLHDKKKDSFNLVNLNFSIKKNETIGIVGRSGSGKSTIIDLIAGLILPDKGEILIDKKKVTEDNKFFWQKNISLVSQSIYLADSSIKENIAFGIPYNEIDNKKINETIEKSQISDFINQLPNGIDTIIGERGVQLSGGQRQRIGIARSLYYQSNLIIFDEATSSLDGLTEEAVIKSINNIQNIKTVVIVAHRLASVKNCHRIYFIDKGKIIDSGTFDELINKNESFRKMANISIN
ncbi:ABC transporter ATP-binding protein/permease [Candidatus Pelagibacter bacterium]|nr:ABC transporter ATP-binding protein/permease [Candidatus Pelagibacter bacterium]